MRTNEQGVDALANGSRGCLARGILLTTLVAGALAGCGDDKAAGGDGGAAAAAGGGTGSDKGTGTSKPKIDGAGKTAGAGKAKAAAAGSGASAEAAARFTTWKPLHAFLGAPVIAGSIVSDHEAIVFTKDNHVGVTVDGGASWGFERITTGSVRAAAGATGGPFVVVGSGGFLALSPDGKAWTDLPRFTNDELWAVAAGEGKVVAVGKNGAFVKVNADGTDAVSGTLPDKLRAAAVTISAQGIVVSAGKKLYQSADARSWTPIEPPTVVAGPKDLATSQGLCAIGKVVKARGVVCSLVGTAYGLGPNAVVVVGKSWLASTKDGGKRWSLAPLPVKNIKLVVGTGSGPIHVGDGRAAVATSADGVSWTVGTDPTVLTGAAEFDARPPACEGNLPGAGEACTYDHAVTTPVGLPEVRALRFTGDVGLAFGDSALVAMTADGGATWKANSGFGLGGVQGFDAAGNTVIAVGKTRAAVSTDAGKSFRTVELPAKTPGLYATLIAADGSVYLAGRTGAILKSDPAVSAFTRLATGDKNRTDYIYLHEVGKALYAAGARGELHRSIDAGTSWLPIATGLAEPIQKMTGEGDTVLAVSSPARWGGNKLLRSNDGGERFFVQRELSDQGVVHDFVLAEGALRYDNLVSHDFGATWTPNSDWYWPGSIDIADGSGIRISNTSSYSGKDRFYVVGPTKDDFTVVDSFYNKGGWLRCAEASGCWMMAGGQIYQPR